jgi:hypothetical protein
VQPASQIEWEPIHWLWLWRLALGHLALLDGDPGLGKSLLALALCARLSTGRPWPDGSPGPGVGNSLFLNAEDSARDTTQPRLQALGADLDRVFFIHQEDVALSRLLALPAQTQLLDDLLTQTQARLVVLDPVVAFLDRSVNVNNDRAVRTALLPLAALAWRHGIVILLIRHLNKLLGGRALYRGGSSIGFQGACRSTWLVGPDPMSRGGECWPRSRTTWPRTSRAWRIPCRWPTGRGDCCAGTGSARGWPMTCWPAGAPMADVCRA